LSHYKSVSYQSVVQTRTHIHTYTDHEASRLQEIKLYLICLVAICAKRREKEKCSMSTE